MPKELSHREHYGVDVARWKQIGGERSDKYYAIKEKVDKGGTLSGQQERFLSEKSTGVPGASETLAQNLKNKLKRRKATMLPGTPNPMKNLNK